MKTKQLGFSDLRFSALGLGTWAMGGGGYECGLGAQDDRESILTIRKAVDEGINWIDTAPMYGLGHAEEVVGLAVEGIRGKVHIATKCGIQWDENKRFLFCLKRDSIRAEIEASLRRLKTDYVDLYQIHLPSPEEEIEEGWAGISELIREGKVRYAGISNFSLEQIQKVQRIHPVASIQPVYSMFNRDVEHGIMEYCAQNGIGILSYSPLCSGLISEGISRERIKNFEPDDFRPRLPDFQEPLLSIHLKAIERLKAFSKKSGVTLSQIAIAWVLRLPEVTSAIVGARCVSHIEEIVKAGNWRLAEGDLRQIDLVLAAHLAEIKEARSPEFTKIISRILKYFMPKLFHENGNARADRAGKGNDPGPRVDPNHALPMGEPTSAAQ
jgi:aryl-alcohol dehydrogenase-like predicted oxidoreductase